MSISQEETYQNFLKELNLLKPNDSFANALQLIKDVDSCVSILKEIPYFLQCFDFSEMNKDNEKIIKTAFLSQPVIEKDDTILVRNLKKESIKNDYLNHLKEIYTADFFASIRDELLTQEKYDIYFSFKSLFTESDFDYIYNIANSDVYNSSLYWKFNYFLKDLIQDVEMTDQVRKRFFNFVVNTKSYSNTYKHLSDESKSFFALAALDVSIYNYSHFSKEDRIKYVDKIDFFTYTNLIKYHPDIKSFSNDELLNLIQKDTSVLAFLPACYLNDNQVFTDEIILETLSVSKNTLILKAIKEKAPKRLTQSFCLKVKEMKNHCSNSSIITKVIAEFEKPEKVSKAIKKLEDLAFDFVDEFSLVKIKEKEKLEFLIDQYFNRVKKEERVMFGILISRLLIETKSDFVVSYLMNKAI